MPNRLDQWHADELRALLDRYVSAARKGDTAGRVRTSGSRATGAKPDVKAVRERANAHGYPVSERGRIPTVVQQAYVIR